MALPPLPPRPVSAAPKRPLSPSTAIIIGLSFTVVILILSVFGLASQLQSHSPSTAAAGPVRTITVNRDVSTGVSQAQFDSCKGAYSDVVGLLEDQTKILQGVSLAASSGFTAVANSDPAALDDATNTITDLTSQEQDLQPRVNAIDTTACR